MGIPYFFHWLLRNHGEYVHEVRESVRAATDGTVVIDSLAIDLNAVIHPVCQKYFGYGDKDRRGPATTGQEEDAESASKTVHDLVVDQIVALVRVARPTRELFVAIDGVAGLSKQMQQRSRRYVREPTDRFDSNCISPGTAFMRELRGVLRRVFAREAAHPALAQIDDIIFSDDSEVGEGEHKIIHHIKKNRNKKYTFCVYSPDADLVMITMPVNRQIVLLRENIYDDYLCDYFLVDIRGLRRKFIDALMRNDKKTSASGSKKKKTGLVSSRNKSSEKRKGGGSGPGPGPDRRLVVPDVLLCCFLFGNDFLPKSPSMHINDYCMNVIFRSIQHVYASARANLLEVDAHKKLVFNPRALACLFKYFSDQETRMLNRKLAYSFKFPDKTLLAAAGGSRRVNVSLYRQAYYDGVVGAETQAEIDALCRDYIQGMLYNIRYYVHRIPDPQWFFAHHHAPLLRDLHAFCRDRPVAFEFERRRFLSETEQLLCILPPSSADLLPPRYRHIMADRSLFPEKSTIAVYADGTKHEWEHKLLLPFIDVDRVLARVRAADATDEEYRSETKDEAGPAAPEDSGSEKK